MSLLREVAGAYGDLTGSMQRQLEARPREARLLAYAFLIGLTGFVAGLPAAVEQARSLDVEDALVAVLTGRLFGAIFLLPLFLYALALTLRGAARVLGGQGSGYDTRLALFWALVLSLPLVVFAGPLAAALPAGIAAALPGLVAFGLFLWILAHCLSEAESFHNPRRVFAVLAGVSCAIGAPIMLGLTGS